MAAVSSPKDEIVTLEYSTVKVSPISLSSLASIYFFKTLKQVPYELLNKKFRAVQKTLDREITHVTNGTAELSQAVKPNETTVSSVSGYLGNIEHRLVCLKRKAEEALEEELEYTRLCKARLDHLKGYVSGKEWSSDLRW